MSREFILDQIRELPWYDVMYIAASDDWILLCKIWPGILAFIALITVAGYIIHIIEKRRRDRMMNYCNYCNEKLDGECVTFGDRLDQNFFLSYHRHCIIEHAERDITRHKLIGDQFAIAMAAVINRLRDKAHRSSKFSYPYIKRIRKSNAEN